MRGGEAGGGAETRLEAPDVSVLVPVTTQDYPLARLYEEFAEPLEAMDIDFEFVFMLQDRTFQCAIELQALRAEGAPIRVLVTGDSQPEGALAHIAARHTRAPVLVTLPSFPVVAADALPTLIEALDDGADMVGAVRDNRGDPLINRLQRRAFHILLGSMVGGSFADIANGVRVVRREALEQMDLYGDFNRFLPMLAVRDGFRVEEVVVAAHEDDRRTRVYHPGVYLRRLIDLVGLMFLIRFTYKPLRFFGLLGTGLMGGGGLILAVLLFQRLGGRGIADRPLLLLGVLLVVMGVQAMAMGLIGEIVVHHNVARRPLYRLRETPMPTTRDAVSPVSQRYDAEAE